MIILRKGESNRTRQGRSSDSKYPALLMIKCFWKQNGLLEGHLAESGEELCEMWLYKLGRKTPNSETHVNVF